MTNLVMHNWNGLQINQAATAFEMQGQIIPVGATNMTDIAKANQKDVHEFLRLSSTQAWMEAYKVKTGQIPGFTFQGRNGGTWGMLPLVLKMCAWISPEFDLWGDETLTKVTTGQEITNADRSEGWGRVAAMGVEVESRNSTPSISPDKDVLALNATLAATTGEGLSRAEIIAMWREKNGFATQSIKANPLKVVPTRWQREPLSVDAVVEIIRMVANRHGDDGWITARDIYRQTRRAGSSNDVKRLLRELESKGVVTCQASEKSTKYRFAIK